MILEILDSQVDRLPLIGLLYLARLASTRLHQKAALESFDMNI